MWRHVWYCSNSAYIIAYRAYIMLREKKLCGGCHKRIAFKIHLLNTS